MKKLLTSVALVALFAGSAAAQSITFVPFGGELDPRVDINQPDGVDNRSFANSASEDERSVARDTDDRGATNIGGATRARVIGPGTHNLAVPNNSGGNSQATLQLGLQNAAGTIQYGSNNEAATIQAGDENTSLILQNGNGSSTGGGLNEAGVVQLGSNNDQIVMQTGNDNAASVLQEGNNNMAVTHSDGNDNVGATVQDGNSNLSFISQGSLTGTLAGVAGASISAPGFISSTGGAGNDNAAAVMQRGNNNQSSVFQFGARNGAFAYQVEN